MNLNRDEGPVLIEGEKHLLKISGTWRSSAGTPMGKDLTFTITAVPPDHACPDPGQWKITMPKPGTQDPLAITLDEALDPAMLHSALRITHDGVTIIGRVEVSADARLWSFTPLQPWQPGTYSIDVDPLLEDLAGNNLQHPFEVDRSNTSPSPKRTTQRTFEVAP